MPDYYEDGDDQSQVADDSDAQESEAETTLVPKSFLGDEKKPGDTCKVEVVAVFEDEYEVRYVKSDEGSEEPAEDVDIAAGLADLAQ